MTAPAPNRQIWHIMNTSRSLDFEGPHRLQFFVAKHNVPCFLPLALQSAGRVLYQGKHLPFEMPMSWVCVGYPPCKIVSSYNFVPWLVGFMSLG